MQKDQINMLKALAFAVNFCRSSLFFLRSTPQAVRALLQRSLLPSRLHLERRKLRLVRCLHLKVVPPKRTAHPETPHASISARICPQHVNSEKKTSPLRIPSKHRRPCMRKQRGKNGNCCARTAGTPSPSPPRTLTCGSGAVRPFARTRKPPRPLPRP